MLKKILTSPCTALLAFFVCLPSIVNAQFRYDYPIVCDNTTKIIQSLGDNWKETLTWGGKHINDNSVYSLWTNEKNGSWTLLKMTSEVSCILGTGSDSKVNLGMPV
jgi:hypothetical protein